MPATSALVCVTRFGVLAYLDRADPLAHGHNARVDFLIALDAAHHNRSEGRDRLAAFQVNAARLRLRYSVGYAPVSQ
jgi:hypothetical protein